MNINAYYMKHLFSLCLAIVLTFSTAQACVKKQSFEALDKPVTIIVMDTTQALLDGAQVTVGKTLLTTSFDGRVVLKPEQWKGMRTFSVACEGYKGQTLTADGAEIVIVKLTPKAGKKPKDDHRYYALGSSRSSRDGVMYKTMAASAKMDVMVADEAAVAEGEMHILPYRPEPSANNNVSAGKLTAGEVNDFTKWQLWPSILEKSHQQYIKDWRLLAKERYTVQVVDKHGYPVVNYPVNLTDTKGNTVFQALTDNTGKAELWNGLTGERAEVNQPVWQSITLEEECANEQLQLVNDRSDVDVVFVFDATGSMGDELRYLQAEMKDVIARAQAATGGLKIRTVELGPGKVMLMEAAELARIGLELVGEDPRVLLCDNPKCGFCSRY